MSLSLIEPYRVRPSSHRAVVSLHAHTCHSKESLAFLPAWISRVPVLGRLWERELVRQRHQGRGLPDFERGFWRPPLSPTDVVESEIAQIRRRFDLEALVSLTDHDSFDGPMALKALPGREGVPVSLEWTVRYCGARFHLGIHNIPPGAAIDQAPALAALSAQPDEDALADVLSRLAGCPSTLVVLNHPLWDGDVNHTQERAGLGRFLERHRPWLHGIELNGYRRWDENQQVVELAERWRLPLVAGGDRHGRAPNALLHLTDATSFDGFVEEIRLGRRSHLVIMPEYLSQPATREFAALADILGTDWAAGEGRRRWSDRVFLADVAGRERPLAEAWGGEIPWWISSFIGVLRMAGSAPARPILRVGLAGGHLSLF